MERSFVSRHPEEVDAARLYRLLVHQLCDFAVFLIDPDGIITTWNAGVERNLGYQEKDFIGQNVSMIFSPEDVATGAPEREREIAGREGSAPDERWHRRKDGSRIYVDGVLSAVRDESGELVGFSKVMRDATRRKVTEDALERSNQELSSFAHVVSHDLQAPLRAIALYSELLQQTQPTEEEKAQYLGFIRDAVTQMQNLIHDLLNYAQISNVKPTSTPADLEKALEQAIRNHQVWIDESGATITHDPLPTVRADETHLVQILQNLIGNAVKYRSAAPPVVHISAIPEGRQWRISVTDNGAGIPPEYQQQIFEPFKRLHGADLPGSGIGLAICKRIVERYGGRIWVDSQPGVGSTFHFTL